MHPLTRVALAMSLVSALAGCVTLPSASEATLTYETVPAGATIMEGGKSLGAAPVTRIYRVEGKAEALTTPEVTAVWASGAKATYFTVVPVGSDRVATINRPLNAPGLQTDLDVAKPLVAARERDAQRQKEAAVRDQARDSARCREQMARGNQTSAASDCGQ